MYEGLGVPRFFSGANSPAGFVSRYDSLYEPENGWHAYILKGGPGTGKSTLMKTAARTALENGVVPQLVYCPSDPDCLDAVVFPELKVCIADGTPPQAKGS